MRARLLWRRDEMVPPQLVRAPRAQKAITSSKEAPERFPEEVWREPVLKYRTGLNTVG